MIVTAALDDLEARVSALEASQSDYRAVLSAVKGLGANQREHGLRLDRIETRVDGLTAEMGSFRRSMEDQLSEINDLIVGR